MSRLLLIALFLALFMPAPAVFAGYSNYPLLPDVAPVGTPKKPAAPAAPAVQTKQNDKTAPAAETKTTAAPVKKDRCAAYAASPRRHAICTDRQMKIQRMLDARNERQRAPATSAPKTSPAATKTK